MANILSKTLTLVSELLSGTKAVNKQAEREFSKLMVPVQEISSGGQVVSELSQSTLNAAKRDYLPGFTRSRLEQAKKQIPSFTSNMLRNDNLASGILAGGVIGLGAGLIGSGGDTSTAIAGATVGGILGGYAGLRRTYTQNLLKKTLLPAEEMTSEAFVGSRGKFTEYVLEQAEAKAAKEAVVDETPIEDMELDELLGGGPIPTQTQGAPKPRPSTPSPAPAPAPFEPSPIPEGLSAEERRAHEFFQEIEAEYSDEAQRASRVADEPDPDDLYREEREEFGEEAADMRRRERIAPETDPKVRKANAKRYRELQERQKEVRQEEEVAEKTQRKQQRRQSADSANQQDQADDVDYNALRGEARSRATPGTGMDKDFGPLSQQGKGLSHLADFVAAPAIGAAVGGIKSAMSYDNSKDQKFEGLKITGTAKAFTKGALTGAGIGLAGVSGIKTAQKLFAGPEGTKSLTSSFLQGMDVGDRVDTHGWGESSQLGTRALSETANETGLRSSLEDMQDALRQRANLSERITKQGAYSPEDAVNFHERITTAGRDMSSDEFNQALRELSAEDKARFQHGSTLNRLSNKAQSSADEFVQFDTGADLNQSRPGKGISELPNLGAFYGGQLVAGIDKSISATRSFYRENVAPETKASNSSFLRRRNPAYLNMADDVEASILGVDQYHGPAMSGFKSTLGAGAGGLLFAGAAGVAAGSGAASSATDGGLNHPMNVLMGARDKYISGQAQMQADASERVRMTNPGAIGLNDIEENYFTNPAMSPKRGRHAPGKYNDTGALTLALSTLRRG